MTLCKCPVPRDGPGVLKNPLGPRSIRTDREPVYQSSAFDSHQISLCTFTWKSEGGDVFESAGPGPGYCVALQRSVQKIIFHERGWDVGQERLAVMRQGLKEATIQLLEGGGGLQFLD